MTKEAELRDMAVRLYPMAYRLFHKLTVDERAKILRRHNYINDSEAVASIALQHARTLQVELDRSLGVNRTDE